MPSLPTPFRAALGLVVTAMEETRHLPDRAVELPMLAVSTALQVSLRAQQRYAGLVAKGDELLARGQTGDEPPEWATFDEPAGAGPLDPPVVVHPLDEPVGPADEPMDVGPLDGPAVADDAGKTVRPPRTGKPSAFDVIGDE